MKYLIQGQRKNKNQVDYSLDDYNVAKFEFSCLKDVCDYVVLYEKDNGLKQLDIHVKI